MSRKRSNLHQSLHRGPATAALESAMKVVAESEASEQTRENLYHQKEKGFSDRFDASNSIESALFGFPRIGWQTCEDQSQQQMIKKQMMNQVREQLNLHHSPHGKHANYPYGHHSGLVRCIYFASDLSETAEMEHQEMEIEHGNQDTTMMMTD